MAVISSAPRRHVASARRPRLWLTRLGLSLALMACDAVAVNAAFVGVYLWRQSVDVELQSQLAAMPSSAWQLHLLLLNVVFAVTFSTSGLYSLRRGSSRIDEALKVGVAVALATFVAYIVKALLTQVGADGLPVDETVLVMGWAVAALETALLRATYRTIVYALHKHGFDTRRVVIVGALDPGRVVFETIRRSPQLGYRVAGFISDSVTVGTLVEGTPVLGRTSSLGRVIRTTQADEVIIALSGRSPGEVFDIIALAEDESVEIKLYPDAFQIITNNEVSIGDVRGLPLIRVKNVALDNPLNLLLKRAFDLTVASLVLTFSSPIMLLIAWLIRFESPGPVFFVQERVGLDGKPFPTLKFRTMRQDAPALGTWTVKDDPRVTAIGAFLRRYSLDELPQFMNVIRGEMSVVGPRPEQPVWVERFSQSIPRYMRRHRQKAGITGWAQVNGLRGDTSVEERTRYDLYYVENWSLLFDFTITIRTAVDVITGKNKGY